MEERRSEAPVPLGLLGATAAAFLLAAAIPAERVTPGHSQALAPKVLFNADGSFAFQPTGEGAMRFTTDGSLPTLRSRRTQGTAINGIDDRATERLIATPTSVQWRHPIGEFPRASLVRAAHVDDHGRVGAVATAWHVPVHGKLPRVGIALPPGALFDPDSGIYVVGSAVWDQSAEFVRKYPGDQKWWKYPGNFHYRGKEAQRSALVSWFPAEAAPGEVPTWTASVGLRVNGNNTRGFPQHALRLVFDEALHADLFDNGEGYERLLLRSAGNDQDRLFLRDALQHRLCAHMPFETSAARFVVVYINGAYWGLHDLRERVDREELARRHGLKVKRITILEDRLKLYEGDEDDVKVFGRLLGQAERWDASTTALRDSLDRYMDVEGFLHYMAAQIILANTDWPAQNGRWWRYNGDPDSTWPHTDGRWRFIMGDSDMGVGLTVGADYDMFAHIERHGPVPLTRLFQACMRSPVLRDRFAAIVEHLLADELSAERMLATLHGLNDEVSGEMPMHIRRWRRPLTVEKREQYLRGIQAFLRDRPAAVRASLTAFMAEKPPAP